MSNDLTSRVGAKINFEGKEVSLRFTLWGLAQFHRVTGKNILEGLEKGLLEDPGNLSVLLWAGMIDELPELDGDIVDGKPDEKAKAGLKAVAKGFTLQDLHKLSFSTVKALQQAGAESSEDGTESEKNE